MLVTVPGSGGGGGGEWGCEKAGSGKQGPQGVLGTPATRAEGRLGAWPRSGGARTPQQTGREPLALLTFGLPQAFLGTLFLGTPRHTPQNPSR